MKLLAPVSLHIAAGSIVAVRGENGAGKTTLLRVLASRVRSSTGHVTVGAGATEVMPDERSAEFRRSVAVMIGMPPPAADLTVLDHVALVASTWQQDPASVPVVTERVLAELAITNLGQRFPDEPEQRLDPDRIRLLGEALRTRRDAGATILFSTHSETLTAAVADRAVWLTAERSWTGGSARRSPSGGNGARAPLAGSPTQCTLPRSSASLWSPRSPGSSGWRRSVSRVLWRSAPPTTPTITAVIIGVVWGAASYPGSTTDVFSPTTLVPVAALLLTAALLFTAVPKLLHALSADGFDEQQAAKWQRATVFSGALDSGPAAETYDGTPILGRRLRAIRPHRRLSLTFFLRDAVTQMRRPLRLGVSVAALTVAGVCFAVVLLGPLTAVAASALGAAASVLVYTASGFLARGLSHAARAVGDVPLYGVSDGALVRGHLLFPFTVTAMVLLLSMFSTAWLLPALEAPASGAFARCTFAAVTTAALVIGLRIAAASQGPLPPGLLAPLDTPAGDLGIVVRIVWSCGELLIAMLVGIAMAALSDSPVPLLLVIAATGMLQLVRWKQRRWRFGKRRLDLLGCASKRNREESSMSLNTPVSTEAPTEAADATTARAPGRVAAAWSVHLFTLTGMVWACLAIVTLFRGEIVMMWLWLGIALVVDSIDGTLARKAEVKKYAPGFDGTVLDVVVDYLTWTFIPALFMYLYLPFGAEWIALAMLLLICVSSVFCYCNVSLKTADNYFMGFPAAWNIVAVALWLLGTGPVFNVVVTIALAVLTVAPLAFVHPFRVARLMTLNIITTIVWIASTGVLVAQYPAGSTVVLIAWWVSGAWLLGMSGLRTVQGWVADRAAPSA